MSLSHGDVVAGALAAEGRSGTILGLEHRSVITRGKRGRAEDDLKVLSKRERINQVLRGKLDELTNRWGIKVTAVEIREIIPPREIQEAMTQQMSSERRRRAMVIEANGIREKAIRVAEGNKQAAILEAEGRRQGDILRAQGASVSGCPPKPRSLSLYKKCFAIGAGESPPPAGYHM